MSIQNPIIRRLLPVALACTLFAALTPAAQAQPAANRSAEPQPGIQSKAKLFTHFSCADLMVVVAASSASVAEVDCKHGYDLDILTEGDAIASGKPAVFLMKQSGIRGPDCTIKLTRGGNTAVLSVQQNYCGFEAGGITASVVRGNATLNGTAEGSYADNLPGLVWFTLNF